MGRGFPSHTPSPTRINKRQKKYYKVVEPMMKEVSWALVYQPIE